MSLIDAFRAWSRLEPSAQRFSLLACLLTPPVTVSLEVLGFRGVRPLLRLPVSRPRLGAEVDTQRGEELVARVFAHTPLTGACLPRSVVQLLTHRLLGRPAELVLGVDPNRIGHPSDFEAHAWVEEPGTSRRHQAHTPFSESIR